MEFNQNPIVIAILLCYNNHTENTAVKLWKYPLKIYKEENSMNKTVKYVLATAVSLAMLLQLGFEIVAQIPASENEPVNTGEINVSVAPALTLNSSVEFTAELTGRDSQKILLSSDNGENKTNASFKGLAPGEYALKVTAPGFADYTQNITVDTQAASVKLLTGFVEGFSYTKDIPHPGALLIGDVNGDGVIDDNDRDSLVNAVDSDNTDNVVDLNGDGEFNLVDLEYLAKSYKNDSHILAAPETSIPSSVISANPGEGTRVEGEVSNLFTNEGAVRLTTENGEAISSENPVSLEINIAQVNGASHTDGLLIGVNEGNPVSKGVLDIVYEENGAEYAVQAPIAYGVHNLLESENVSVEQDEHGNIEINLGSQIAVKKVTVRISEMQNSSDLAEISYVEFVNGMEERIPEPSLDIPENLTAKAGSKTFTLNWDSCVNVTGYEVMIKQGDKFETVKVAGNSLAVSSFGGKELVNNTDYTVSVQSVNGTWSSGYCDPITVTPKPDRRPDKPDNVKAVGKYRSVVLSWKKMEDTDYYNVYYKSVDEDAYHKVEGVPANSYTVNGLEDKTEYTAYVTGVNEIGESGPSLSVTATTTDLEPAVVPKYKLINFSEAGEASEHITGAWYNSGSMIDSPLDSEGKTAWGTVDNSPLSHYLLNSWDGGGYNYLGSNGLFYEFDREYTIQKIALQEITPSDLSYFYTKINYWDKDGKLTSLGRNAASIQKKSDKDGHPYYLITLPQKAQIKKIQIGLARYLASEDIDISEMYFYHFDPIGEDIYALFEDDLHTTLRAGVTQSDIDALRTRLNTPDEISGELNPELDIWERELKNAEDILNNTGLRRSQEIHTTISTGDANRGFGGINAWQPLGITADAGDNITVYVGHNSKKSGENTNLQLVATQYHSEFSPMFKVIATLKTGMNIIDIPKLWTTDAESGGALYIQYTGNNANERYAVRVSGGNAVPVLDLYKVTDEEERKSRTESFIADLTEYAGNLEALHNEIHKNSDNKNVNKYEYSERNCVLGAADIMLDTMMLSLPAKQIVAGAGTGTAAQKAEKMLDSFKAMEDMMYLFYQHKGLNANAEKNIDAIPKGHLNIRYQRMFGGAFMYAAGNHIGIEWAQCSGMVNCTPLVADKDGRYVSGRYFGWGIAHEIGHCINQGSYAVAEITNNYYAQLAQAKDSNAGMRFTYENIYKKVTSGAIGTCPNIATQLGMYWQLHLAYDNVYNYKTFEDPTEQFNSLFYARVDTYARTPSLAPAPDGIALTLRGGTDQVLMRLSCAAAEKNILAFFKRWGKIPDSDTVKYAEQFEEETRAIYYVDDNSKVYRIENPDGGVLGTESNFIAVGDETAAKLAASNSNQVNLTLTSQNIPEEDILGYEIVRCTISGGVVTKEAVGFSTENTYTDYVATMNNRVVTYEVTLIDKYLNRSAAKVLEPIKIRTDGSVDKTNWMLSYNDIKAESTSSSVIGDDNSPCDPVPEDRIYDISDGNDGTVYTATIGANAEIIVEFGKTLTISGFKYKAGDENPIGEYVIMAKDDTGAWVQAAKGAFGGDKSIYFSNEEGKYVSTYKTDAIKLVIPNQAGNIISVAEIDVLGVTGDNVDFRETSEGVPAIGILSESYRYAEGEEHIIPEGSIVFIGTYKGNPAYNTVLLYDDKGGIVGGFDDEGYLKSEQIILADVPETGNIQDVSDGTWIYWIKPDSDFDIGSLNRVRAELYRVNNALTNEGQRMVSDSFFIDIPDTLPSISLTGNH